jgi:hypothetical protein
MPSWIDETEEVIRSGRIKVPYQWWVGETGAHFFSALRDEGRILGSYCPKCDLVFLPPRKSCGRCFSESMEWREVSDEGSVMTFTIPRLERDIHPLKQPFAYAVIKLEGADTGLTHLLWDFNEEDLKVGMRVKAVFNEDKKGNIFDIKYFKPI